MPTMAPIYTETDCEVDSPKWHIGGKVVHVPLAKCNVLYLGCAPPTPGPDGLEAVQKPLAECFPLDSNHEVEGVNFYLTVFSSGVQMQHEEDRDATWYPIQTLQVCAAAKCVVKLNTATGQRFVYFAALDSDDAAGSDYPPMFCAIFHKPNSPHVLECHVFITKSFQAAMALVQSSTHAYDHREGWTDEPPPVDYLDQMEREKQEAEDRKPKKKQVPVYKHHAEAPPEFYQRPPEAGYFYASNKDLVRRYHISDHNKRGPPVDVRCHPGPPPHGPIVRPVMVPPVRIPVPVRYPVRVPVPVSVPVRPGRLPKLSRMPPPPSRRYFEGWNEFNGLPIAVFPRVTNDEVRRVVRRNMERKRRKHKRARSSKVKHQTKRPMTPPAGMFLSPTRWRSPRPHYFSDHYFSSEDERPHEANRRSRYEPPRRAPRRAYARDRDYAEDFAVYGDAYFRNKYM